MSVYSECLCSFSTLGLAFLQIQKHSLVWYSKLLVWSLPAGWGLACVLSFCAGDLR